MPDSNLGGAQGSTHTCRRPFRRAVGVLVAALVIGCVITIVYSRTRGYDDAYISYRYASNLVHGHGLVFNPGERVEGYSNLLYVLVMTAGLAFVPELHAYALSTTINVACLAAALVVFMVSVERRLDAQHAIVAGSLFAFSPLVWYLGWTGLETALVVLLFVCVWALLPAVEAGGRRATAALAALLPLLILARADGFVMVALVLGYLAIALVPRGHARGFALCAGASAATLLAHFGWRYAYYGVPLPNTYYAKVSGDLADRLEFAWRLIQAFAALQPYLLVIAAAFGMGALELGRRLYARQFDEIPDRIAFEWIFPVGWVAYWFYVGGDIFGMRLLLVLLPLGIFLVVRHAGGTLFEDGTGSRWLTAGVLALLAALPFQLHRPGTTPGVYDAWDTLGLFLGNRFEGATVAVDGAGKIPFYSRLAAIDMFGLNDATIARRDTPFVLPGHDKHDTRYVLSRRPDLITGWIERGSLDLHLGLTERRYRKAGYRLVYMLYTPPDRTRDLGATPIIQVDALPRRELYASWAQGYRYGVLVRESAATARALGSSARSARRQTVRTP